MVAQSQHTSVVPLAWQRRMSRSLSLIVSVSVIVLGLWHIYASHHASFLSEVFEGDGRLHGTNVLSVAILNSSLEKYKQKKLVNRVDQTQNLLKHPLNVVEGLEHKTHQRLEHTRDTNLQMKKKIEDLQVENEKLRIRSVQLAKHIADSTEWRPLKDRSQFSIRGFMSEITSRKKERGPPELFEFPSALSNGRHLCFRGNNTRNGIQNSYTFAWEEALPNGYILLNGTTLISETEYDHNNPWHSMYNAFQFVYWKLKNGCANGDRLILFHQSELRRRMGDWITQIFTACGLPPVPEAMPIGDRPICFQRAVVSRLGMGGVPTEIFREVYGQARCQVRAHCKLPTTRSTTVINKQSINITLMVRSGARQWKDQKAWESVIADACGKVEGCQWVSMRVANMTFCEQVKSMMETDILVSVHGAQLTNMIFMSPGGRLMEMFPKGWLELAGGGQYIYRQLASWNGLVHEGYWRDVDQPECPSQDDKGRCFTFYKDQNVGMNITYISAWLGKVLEDFKETSKLSALEPSNSQVDSRGDYKHCACVAN